MDEPKEVENADTGEFPVTFKEKLVHFDNVTNVKREKFEVKVQKKKFDRLKSSVEPLKRKLTNITRPIIVVPRTANPIYGKLSFTIASSSMIIISFIFE